MDQTVRAHVDDIPVAVHQARIVPSTRFHADVAFLDTMLNAISIYIKALHGCDVSDGRGPTDRQEDQGTINVNVACIAVQL